MLFRFSRRTFLKSAALAGAAWGTGLLAPAGAAAASASAPFLAGPDRYGFDNEFLTNNCTVIYDAKRAYCWDEAGRKTLCGNWEPYATTAIHLPEAIRQSRFESATDK